MIIHIPNTAIILLSGLVERFELRPRFCEYYPLHPYYGEFGWSCLIIVAWETFWYVQLLRLLEEDEIHGPVSFKFFFQNHVVNQLFFFVKCTLPKTNIAPTNGWLEYYFPIGEAYFQGLR